MRSEPRLRTAGCLGLVLAVALVAAGDASRAADDPPAAPPASPDRLPNALGDSLLVAMPDSARAALADSLRAVAADTAFAAGGVDAALAAAAADPALAAAVPDSLLAMVRPEEIDFWDSGISPARAVLMTPVMPGWGQLYARTGWKAALAFGIEWYYWSHMLARDRQAVRVGDIAGQLPAGPERDFFAAVKAEYHAQVRDYAWWSAGVLFIVALDAYVGARLFGFDEDPVPIPDRWDDHFPEPPPEPIGSTGAPTLVIWSWGLDF